MFGPQNARDFSCDPDADDKREKGAEDAQGERQETNLPQIDEPVFQDQSLLPADAETDQPKKHEQSPKGKKCKAMEGLVEEGSEVIEEDMTPEVRDAALIAAAQRVEHYEMAGYGCVRTYAQR